MKNLAPVLIAAAVILTAIALWPNQDADAAIPIDVAAELGRDIPGAAPASPFSTTVTCAPMALWNPDAGVGLVRCGAGYDSLNVESSTTTAVKFVWRYKDEDGGVRFPVTRADLATHGMPRAAGGVNGSVYRVNSGVGQRQLFCVTQLDAGVVLPVECMR